MKVTIIDEASFISPEQWAKMGEPFARYERKDYFLNGELVHSRWYADDGHLVAEMSSRESTIDWDNEGVVVRYSPYW